MVGLAVSLVLFLVIVALLTTYRYTVYLPRDAETMDWAHSARTEPANNLGIDLENVSYYYNYWNISFTIHDDNKRI